MRIPFYRNFNFSPLFGLNRADFQAKFGGIIEKLNLAGDPGACRAHINEFIANTTNNHLTDVLSENDIGQYTNFVVANAAYFQADWMFPFPAEMTAQATFNGLSGKFDVQMMKQEDTFLFGERKQFQEILFFR